MKPSEEKQRRNVVREQVERRGFHYDPVLLGFIVFAVVFAIAKLVHAQVPTPTPAPAPPAVDPGIMVFGIPLGAIIQIGVPAILCVYLVVKGIPQVQKDADARLEKREVACAAELENARKDKDAMRSENAAREIAVRAEHAKEVAELRADNRRLQDMLVDRSKAV